MAQQQSVKAVVFDLGGVLIPAPMDYWKDYEKRLGLANGSILKTLMEPEVYARFVDLETGRITNEDFAPIFTYHYNWINSRSDPTNISPFDADTISNIPLDERLLRSIEVLRASGVRTALLTNNFYYDRARLRPTLPRDASSGDVFDVVVESCRTGLRKPSAAIYQLVAKQLKLEPSSLVFLDDLGANLKGAAQLGIKTIKVTSTDQAVRDLQALLPADVDLTAPPTTRSILPREKLPDTLSEVLERHAGIKCPQSELKIRRFRHGQSNPTYWIRAGDRELVLRKKPSGKLLPSAHQIEREWKVMSALTGTAVPVPKLYALVENDQLDTPFYLMEFVDGRLVLDIKQPSLSHRDRTAIVNESVRVLAALHDVDFKARGLGNYGKQGDYMRRNLNRWILQYQAAAGERQNAAMDELIEWLQNNVQDDFQTTIVHGDYRVDNILLSPEFKALAVLDWELSSLGDPLADLATLAAAYFIPANNPLVPGLGCGSDVEGARRLGVPSLDELVNAYFKARNLPRVSDTLWTFYLAFVFFRFASILEGVYARHLSKQASSVHAAFAARGVEAFSKLALGLVKQHERTADSGKLITSPSALSPKARAHYDNVKRLLLEDIIPLEKEVVPHLQSSERFTTLHPKLEELKEKARALGAWNLFVPTMVDPKAKWGAGLSNVEYAHICELMGRSLLAPETFNCQAPDTGNMEVLMKYGTPEQQEKWLKPLLAGKIKSCFAMTEPDVASSDATNIQATIVRLPDNRGYLINSRKWFTSNAAHPNCEICVFMGRVLNQDKVARHTAQSMLLVPMRTPGVRVIRNLSVLGMDDAPGGHCEVVFENVVVPPDAILVGEGRGFEIAQGRLGPGRIHHAMRMIGHAERALQIAKERMRERVAFGKKLNEFDSLRKEIAECRIAIDQARLLVLHTAHIIDISGTKAATAEIAMIKVAVPRMTYRVVDIAIQILGAKGLTSDSPLAFFLVGARSLRVADGPDTVHLDSIAKQEFAKL